MKSLSIPLAGLILAAAGCVTLQKVQPAEFLSTHRPEVVWVTTDNNVHTPILQPQIVGDSLQGTRQYWPPRSVAISLKEINYVQAELPSPKRTALLVTLVGATVAGLVYAIATSEGCCSPHDCGVLKDASPGCLY
jgi:hypothetical protein